MIERPIAAHLPIPGWIVLVILVTMSQAMAQDLERVGQEQAVNVSGGVQFFSTGYAARGIHSRRNPFTWIASGSLNVDLYGLSIPLSFSYTNNQGTFQQPFNRYGISPYYQWVKTYIGFHSLTYSSYTLNGHLFLGSGVELTPGNFRCHAMYGRFQKAVPADTTSSTAQSPAYTRRGAATKLGYETTSSSIHLILFYASDDSSSLNFPPLSQRVLPEQNLVVSLTTKQQLGQRITWQGEWAKSFLTLDQSAPRLPGSAGVGVLGGWFMPVRETTTQQQALKANLKVAFNRGYLQGGYERVDPNYRTLGSYFFTNDLENITLGAGWQFWKDHVNISIQSGVQRNNLDQTEINQTRRWVSNLSANVRPVDRWQCTATYSNFTSFTNQKPQPDPFFNTEFDTLNFYQINQSAAFTSTYSFGNDRQNYVFTLSSNYQKSQEIQQGSDSLNIPSRYYSNQAMYRVNLVPTKLSLSLGGNLYHSTLIGSTSTTIGPSLSVSKGFESKLRSTFTTSFNQVSTNRTTRSRVMNTRWSASYSPAESHRFSLNINLLSGYPVEQPEGFSEWTAIFRYHYSF